MVGTCGASSTIKLGPVQSVWGWLEVEVKQVESRVLVLTGGRRGFDWVYIIVWKVFIYPLH